MHHIHVSTEFLFVGGLMLVGLVGVTLAYVRSIKRDKLLAKQYVTLDHTEARLNTVPGMSEKISEARTRFEGAPFTFPNRPVYPAAAPSYAAPVAPVVVHDSNNGLLTGLLVGEMLAGGGHHHDTYVNNTYVNDTPSSSWGSSSDSGSSGGFSYDSGSSSSYDSGSSGGFDASF